MRRLVLDSWSTQAGAGWERTRRAPMGNSPHDHSEHRTDSTRHVRTLAGSGFLVQTARKYRFVTHDWMPRLIGPPARASNAEGREKAVIVKVTAPLS